VIQDDAADGRAAFAQPFRVLEVGAIDLRVVRQLPRPVNGEAGVSNASNAGVELLLARRLLRSATLIVHVGPVSQFSVQSLPFQLIAMDVRPPIALEYIPASFREHHERAVFADGRNRLDEPGVSQVPQIAAVWVERSVLAVAEIAGRHNAEGAHGRERANLRGAQRHIAVSRPHALARMAARQLEIARKHVAWIEPLAFPRIGQPTTTALVEFATVDIAVARVVNRPRVEIHRHLPWEKLV
jgi:hypothetical protein